MQSESDYVYNVIRSDTDDGLTIISGKHIVLVISAFFFSKNINKFTVYQSTTTMVMN